MPGKLGRELSPGERHRPTGGAAGGVDVSSPSAASPGPCSCQGASGWEMWLVVPCPPEKADLQPWERLRGFWRP